MKDDKSLFPNIVSGDLFFFCQSEKNKVQITFKYVQIPDRLEKKVKLRST